MNDELLKDGTHIGACKGHETKGHDLTPLCSGPGRKDTSLAIEFQSEAKSLFYHLKESGAKAFRIINDDSEIVGDIKINPVEEYDTYVGIFNIHGNKDNEKFKADELIATVIIAHGQYDSEIYLNPKYIRKANSLIQQYNSQGWTEERLKEVAWLTSGIHYGVGKSIGYAVRADKVLEAKEVERVRIANEEIDSFNEDNRDDIRNGTVREKRPVPLEFVGQTSEGIREMYDEIQGRVLKQFKQDWHNYSLQKDKIEHQIGRKLTPEDEKNLVSRGIMPSFQENSPLNLVRSRQAIQNVLKDETELFPEMFASFHYRPDEFNKIYPELYAGMVEMFDAYPQLVYAREKYLKAPIKPKVAEQTKDTKPEIDNAYVINHGWEEMFTGASGNQIWNREMPVAGIVDNKLYEFMSESGHVTADGKISKKYRKEFERRGVDMLNYYNVRQIKPLAEKQHYELTMPTGETVKAYNLPHLYGLAVSYSARKDKIEGKMKLAIK